MPVEPDPLESFDQSTGIIHASCVARNGRALLITGTIGKRKVVVSALRLLSLGCALVADDRTKLSPGSGADAALVASRPDTLPPLIEARGLGLLSVPMAPPTAVVGLLDLATIKTERLPPMRSLSVLGIDVPLLHNAESPHFAAALRLYLDGTDR